MTVGCGFAAARDVDFRAGLLLAVVFFAAGFLAFDAVAFFVAILSPSLKIIYVKDYNTNV
jgi:hypothetical protein